MGNGERDGGVGWMAMQKYERTGEKHAWARPEPFLLREEKILERIVYNCSKRDIKFEN